MVTTAGPDAARNFGVDDQPAHAVRYERAAEFIEVAQKLWDSWEDDAVLADKADGVWGDSEKIRTIDHEGKHFKVRGPLNVPRSPQGHPLIVQAGSSEDGKDLAARYADAVFTAHQTLADAQDFYRDLKARTAAAGRDPETIKILPGIVPVIGATEEEAQALERELDRLIKPEYARIQLAKTLRVAPEDLPLDRQLPDNLPSEDEIEGAKSRYTLIVQLARREKLTVRELIGRLGGGRGHRTFTGTPVQVADAIQEWFDGGAADGFNIMPPVLPSGLETFVDQVVPILQERGLFRTEYTGRTLREHYGLERPGQPFCRCGRGGTGVHRIGVLVGRQLKLNLFIYPGGHHEAAWRHPKSQTDRLLDIRFYQELAQRAEAAKLDAVFFADGPGAGEQRAVRHQVPAGAVHLAVRDRRRHRTDRPDRHGQHHVPGAVQRGPAVRVAGPPQRRPRRLEHRHHRRGTGGPELRPGRAPAARRALLPGGRIRPRGGQALGQLGGRGGGVRRRHGGFRRHLPDPSDRA